MVTIGKYEVILNDLLLIPLDEPETWVTAYHGDDYARIKIIFQDESTKGAKGKTKLKRDAGVKIEGAGDHAVVTVFNWSGKPLGAATAPLKIGLLDNGRPLYIMLDCHKIEKVAHLLIQVMIGGAQ